jgi:hypothetical protein
MEMAENLSRHISEFAAIAREARAPAGEKRVAEIRRGLTEWMMDRLRAHGCSQSAEVIEQRMAMDLQLDAQGLDIWLSRLEQA